MEDILKSALEFSNFRKNLELQKKTLKDKLAANLTIGHDGGIFYIDQSLIVFIEFLISKSRIDNIPIIDRNGNPINIKNILEFQEKILDVYFTSTNDYLLEFEKLKVTRSNSDLLKL
jgi:hypothetical protein